MITTTKRPSSTRLAALPRRLDMRTSLSLLCLLSAMLLLSVPLSANIGRDPNGVNVNSQGATTVFITFFGLQNQVPVEATWCGELIPATPDIGMRCDPTTIFGRLPIRFDQSTLNGQSTAFTDIMSIPPSVARRAYQAAARGETSSFFYVRRFVSTTGGPDEYVFVTCRMAGGGARVPLALTDVQVRFDDDATVQRVDSDAVLPPFEAEITYNGTGRLRGRWEVVLPGEEPPSQRDLLTEATLPPEERATQRRYTVVRRFDVFLPPIGRTVLPGPDPSRLPTLVDGLYQILLRIEASDDKEADSNLGNIGGNGVIHAGAVAGFSMPVLRYVVGDGAGLPMQEGLFLVSPPHGATLEPGPIEFRWTQADGVQLYRLELRAATGADLHQALLQQGIGSYRAPSWLRERAAGTAITWRVVALAAGGEEIGATEWRELAIP